MSSRRWLGPAVLVALVAAVVVVGLQQIAGFRYDPEAPPPADVPTAADTGHATRDADRPRTRAADGAAPETTAPAAGETSRVVVHVTNAVTRAPIAGARVEASIMDFGGALGWSTQSTDAEGRARFGRQSPGHVEIVCRAHDHVRAAASADLVVGEERTVEIALAPATSVHGLVVRDEDGAPVAGARIEAVEGGSVGGTSQIVQQAVSALGETQSDDRSAYRLDCLSPGEVVTLRVTAPGRASANVPFVAPTTGKPAAQVEIRLEAGGRVRGIVRDRQGGTSRGASVYLVLADTPALLKNPDSEIVESSLDHLAVLRARAGDDGEYAVDGVRLGVAYFALADDPVHALSEPVPGVRVTADRPDVALDLVVRDPGALDLTVLTAAGAPVAGAELELRHARETTKRTTGATGRVLAAGLELGQHVVTVHAAHLPMLKRAYAVEEGRTTRVELRLSAACAIEGVVVDDLGHPVAGARVLASRPPWEPEYKGLPDSEGDAVSGAEGRFRVDGLLEGLHEVRAQETNRPATGTLAGVSAPAAGVRLVSLRRGAVRFRLLPPAGSAKPAKLHVHIDPFNHHPDWTEGAIEIGGVVAGAINVDFRIPGFVEFSRHAEVRAGEVADLGDIALDPGHTLRGRLEDAQDRPVAGAEVETGDVLTPTRQKVTTGADGTFRLEHLAAGPNYVQVSAAGFLPLDVPLAVVPGEPVVVVRLVRGGLLRGTVRRADGALVPDAHVEVVDAAAKARGDAMDDRRAWPRTDARGVFEARLLPGRYHVVVQLKIIGRTVIRAETDAELTEGGTTPIVVDLPE